MKWNQRLKRIGDKIHRVLYDEENKEVIEIVDNLDRDFILYVIEKHNEEVDLAFRNGIKEGREIVKNVFKI